MPRNDDGTVNVTNTFWTDAFIYWLDNDEVVEGSLLAFFSDISQDRAVNTLCFNSFQYERDLALQIKYIADKMAIYFNYDTLAQPV